MCYSTLLILLNVLSGYREQISVTTNAMGIIISMHPFPDFFIERFNLAISFFAIGLPKSIAFCGGIFKSKKFKQRKLNSKERWWILYLHNSKIL